MAAVPVSIDAADAPPAPGKRARNKADKLQRIRAAAHALFIEKGYDGTTLRDVAARSGVGFGTIFDYAANKRDLLFLIFNPQVVETLEAAHEAALIESRFIDRLMRIFGGFYGLYRREPAISRFALRELTFFSDSHEARQFIEHRTDFFARVSCLVADAQSAGQLASTEQPETIAQILFAIFAWEVRRWLASEQLDIDAGFAHLRRLLSLQIAGFEPREGAF